MTEGLQEGVWFGMWERKKVMLSSPRTWRWRTQYLFIDHVHLLPTHHWPSPPTITAAPSLSSLYIIIIIVIFARRDNTSLTKEGNGNARKLMQSTRSPEAHAVGEVTWWTFAISREIWDDCSQGRWSIITYTRPGTEDGSSTSLFIFILLFLFLAIPHYYFYLFILILSYTS